MLMNSWNFYFFCLNISYINILSTCKVSNFMEFLFFSLIFILFYFCTINILSEFESGKTVDYFVARNSIK